MMKKYNILIALLLMVVTAGAQTIEKWKLADLKSAIARADKPTVFNFWATWCGPCVAELPYINQLVKKYSKDSVQLVMVSLDMKDAYPEKLQTFVSKRGYTAKVVFLDETNADMFCPAVDPQWQGTIPVTLFIDNKKGYRKFKEDQMKRSEVEKEIRAMLK